jgi:UDP-N-acetylglucosamine:LPS N-acetylglucosamine transferase
MKYYKDFVVFGFKNSIFRNPNKQLEQNNEAKFRVVGPLAEKKHFSKKDTEKIKEQYGLNNGKDTVILASGSIGGRFLLEMVNAIYKKCDRPINLIVVCGKDEKTYEKLKTYSGVSLSVNLMPFKYIDKFDEVLAAADCIIGRPSAGIFIESILNRTPEITFRKATSNDKGTLTMIEKYNIGKVIESKEDIAAALEEILNNKELYANNIEKLINKYTLSYEDKTELIKNIILTDDSLNYELNEIKAQIGFNAHMSN